MSDNTELSEEAKNLEKGVYEHFKGKEYYVMGVALDSETQEEMVVYRALYGEHRIWVRPLGEFLEEVEVDSEAVPRFELKEYVL